MVEILTALHPQCGACVAVAQDDALFRFAKYTSPSLGLSIEDSLIQLMKSSSNATSL